MKRMKRLIPCFALVLLFGVLFSACSLLPIETPENAKQTTGNGGKTEMTTASTTSTTAAHVHEFGEWAETDAATCTAAGTKRRVCACGAFEERKVVRLGHTAPGEDGKCTRCLAQIGYSFPMDQVTKLDGTIRTKQNDYYVSTNYYGAAIDLSDLPYDTVRITKRAGAEDMGYAFLTALPVTNGQKPAYTAGYTKVIWDTNETATVGIPTDAKYLYVYYASKGVVSLPSAIMFYNTDVPATFTVASWNIGHFSMGGKKTSTITDDAYATEKAKYLSYINSLGADILCLNEYSELFTPSHPAYELFFGLGTTFEGEQRNYSCNAIYSKFPLKNEAAHNFACNTSDVVLHTTAIQATDYYYVTGELKIGDETVTIVTLHLAFHEKLKPDTVCTNQMDELIAKFADTEHVVLLGDWNAYYAEYYDRFAEAGYTVANDGSYLTCTGSKTGGLEWPVDNIIVKGVTMTDFRAVNTDLSDHIAVVATITLE